MPLAASTKTKNAYDKFISVFFACSGLENGISNPEVFELK